MSDPTGETSPGPAGRTRDRPAEAGTGGMSDATGETNPGTAT
jgi:hypothetical protein